jgi:hypothetical protein
MLLVLALVPMETVLSGANILSVLAERVNINHANLETFLINPWEGSRKMASNLDCGRCGDSLIRRRSDR